MLTSLADIPPHNDLMVNEFSRLLNRLIDDNFPSKLAFTSKAEPKRPIGSASSYLTRVLQGIRPPPLDRIEAWADALNLEGPARNDFIQTAWMAHCPSEVQELMATLRKEMQALRAKQAELMARLDTYEGTANRRAAEASEAYPQDPSASPEPPSANAAKD